MTHIILLIEDDEHIMDINRGKLEKAGYRVLEAETLRGATALLETEPPDLIVLDVMLPDGNGVKWCEKIRGGSGDPPVLFLSAKDKPPDILEGFGAGGDAYLTKPYDLNVLLANIKALLDRASRMPKTIKKGVFSFDVTTKQAYFDGKDILLAPKEFALLSLFAQNEGENMSAENIYKEVWGQAMVGDTRSLRNCVYTLRDKLADVGCEYRIEKVYGTGYRFEKNID